MAEDKAFVLFPNKNLWKEFALAVLCNMISRQIDRAPAWSLAVGAMFSVQLGATIAIKLFPLVGVMGATWIRIAIAALAFVGIARPRYTQWTLKELRAPALLGVVSAMMTLSFFGAIDRIPLGTTVAIEFLGPLTVAAAHSKNIKALAWPFMALIGVVLMTEPWHATPDFIGITFAALAGACWGLYILITQHVGDRFDGVDGLAISLPIATLVLAVFGLPKVWGHLTMHVLLLALAAAIMLPLIPWTLEIYALRRLTKSAFGTLMALEPAIALMIGVLVLNQEAAISQLVGIVFVVVAGVTAERTGAR